MVCPKCSSDSPEGVRFCEVCGLKMVSDPPANPQRGAISISGCRCGAGVEEIDENGYCLSCGLQRSQVIRNHREESLSSTFAAITDIGLRHFKNEDDFAISIVKGEAGEACIVVVCDGLSSASNSDDASTIACRTAQESLELSVQLGGQPAKSVAEAIFTAHQAVCSLPLPPAGTQKDPPETTIVLALIDKGVATVGWVGDSRAYWITKAEATPLTHDHSWVNEVVDSGQMLEEEALLSKQAHAITQCLGRLDGEPALIEPSYASLPIRAEGKLLLCSDGLWNYAPKPADIFQLVNAVENEPDCHATCLRLIEFARSRGGRDNITVAILNFHMIESYENVSFV